MSQSVTGTVHFLSGRDVGVVRHPGSTVYDPVAQTYRMRGAGHNMWLDRDAFHVASVEVVGNLSLSATARFIGAGVDPHRKLGLIIHSDLSATGAHANVVVHGDGLTSLQFRRAAGAGTEELRSPLTGAVDLAIERVGSRITIRVARAGEVASVTVLEHLYLGPVVQVGLFVCSHNVGALEEAVFSHVRLVRPFLIDQLRYRDYLGSHLEVVEVVSGERRIIHSTPDPIEAPNWTVDGRTLIYNSRGRLFRFPVQTQSFPMVTGGAIAVLDTGFATRNNNDHVLSFDGRSLGISHHVAEEDDRSIIFTLPTEGGIPHRVTPLGPSYLHGWSPDGRHLIYTGGRAGAWDIYRISVDGGAEERLTTTAGLDDGAEYTPDGRFIYFNSNRSGRMQIWRMQVDGSNQEAVTNDEYNNWFPHVSPDGRWVVFLSYGPEVPAGDHPYYAQVMIRMMPASAAAGSCAMRVIARLYGGQGTINVPSWSPCSRYIAFVSNTGPI
jgi:TolB protein